MLGKRIPELAELINIFRSQRLLQLYLTLNLTLYLLRTGITMLSRTIRRSIASPFRRNVVAPAARPAFRFVTTDAASSHTDPENVPEVIEAFDKPLEKRVDYNG